MEFIELILLFLLTPLTAAQGPAVAGSGSIQGMICEIETCRPVSGARLAASIPGAPASGRTALSDDGGFFRFPQLVPGKYLLQVQADNLWFEGILPLVTLEDGANIQLPNIQLRPLGTISGHAFDENGDPLANALAEAIPVQTLLTGPVQPVETDDRGEFRIASLYPDQYYLCIRPPGKQVVPQHFPPTCYPSTTDAESAEKIVVRSGEEVTNIDPRLTTRGVSVRGQLVGKAHDGARADVFLISRSPANFLSTAFGANASDRTDDDFELSGVAPGSYYLYAVSGHDPATGTQWVRLPLEVAGKDIENVTIPMLPTGSIDGRVIMASGSADGNNPDFSSIVLHAASPENTPGFLNPEAHPSRSGEFHYANLSETQLFFRDQVIADRWFISSIRLDGQEVSATGFSSNPGQRKFLEVTLSDAGGVLSGIVKDNLDKPIPAGRLVLLPEPPLRSNPFLIRTAVAIERGEFAIETIPPGVYTAIAFPDEDTFTPAYLRNLRNVEKYERFGQRVQIDPGETTRLDLVVATPDPQ